MRRACVLLADGFEEIEAVTAIDVLRRAGVETVMVSVGGPEVRGSHGIVVRSDQGLATARAKIWDAIVLPGGMPGAATLRDTPAVQSFLRAQATAGVLCAAICAAPIALAKAGLLDGRRATCYPEFEEEIERGGAKVCQEAVCIDGAIVTSRGPGTALAFALTLTTMLASDTRAAELAKAMLVG